jgi:RNA polymerase subunit RPABC4/transcription elongation factor Spt4/cbb3-type cytochrome oxidase subunit 3
MMSKLFSVQKGLRVFLLILAVVSVLSLTVSAVAESSRNKKIQSDRNKIREGFEAILEELEFNGLNDSTLELVQEYRKLVGENSNLIISDDAGYVLYHVNNGFMPGTDQFIVITDPDSHYSNMAYILDPELSVRYRISLNRTYNSMKLIEYSNTYKDNVNLYDVIRRDEAYYGHSGDTVDKTMYYAYIGSKGWNVYSIQKNINYSDYEYNNWHLAVNSIGVMAFILFWLALPVWVFLDAKKRNHNPALWGILTAITNIIGLIIYILTRPENPACKNCGEPLTTKHIYCPYCGAENKQMCHSCRTILEKNWLACPTCGQKIESERPEALVIVDGLENNP